MKPTPGAGKVGDRWIDDGPVTAGMEFHVRSSPGDDKGRPSVPVSPGKMHGRSPSHPVAAIPDTGTAASC